MICRIRLDAIADGYKLTPAEMRVLMMIVEVGGVPEVAPVLGISESTVKTHLQRLFAKTGTSRQADLRQAGCGLYESVGALADAALVTASDSPSSRPAISIGRLTRSITPPKSVSLHKAFDTMACQQA